MKDEKSVPRWQQGLRPSDLSGYGEVWDEMTPRERRRSFIDDLIICAVFAFVIYMIFGTKDDRNERYIHSIQNQTRVDVEGVSGSRLSNHQHMDR